MLHKNKGLTLDPMNNEMLRQLQVKSKEKEKKEKVKIEKELSKESQEGCRSDRIVYISKDSFWDTLYSVKLFGTDQISFFENLYPSTHFGVSVMVESSKVDSGACSIM